MTRRRLALAALAVLAAGSAGAACGGGSSSDEPNASVTTVSTRLPATTTASGPARPGMPTVPTAERTIPRATTKEAVIEGRPAVIVTLPETVLFDVGEAVLRADAEPSLQGVVDLVGTKPGATTQVQGHTDSTGSAEFNLSLSERRATAVADWLAGHGIDRATLSTAGFGSTKPVADNATEAGRQANRRVEIIVTSPAS